MNYSMGFLCCLLSERTTAWIKNRGKEKIEAGREGQQRDSDRSGKEKRKEGGRGREKGRERREGRSEGKL